MQRRLAILGILLVAAIAAADWQIIAMQRAAAIDDFRTATTNLANGMAAQTSRSLAAADRLLQDIRGSLTTIPDATPERIQADMRSRAISDMLTGLHNHVAGVDALAVVDADGLVANTTRSASASPLDLSDQDFFQYFRSNDDPGPFVGTPRTNQAGGRRTSILARRIDDRSGAFAGVVVAEISLSDLEDFYRVAIGQIHRTIMVLRRDGLVLVRYPGQADAVGRSIPENAPWHDAVAAGGGSYVGLGHFDHVPIVAVVRPLSTLPLVVEASVTEADALAGWSRQRFWLILGGIAAAALVLALIRLFAAQLHRLAIRNSELDEARGRLDAALANITQGLSFFDGDQRLIVCNRRFGEMYSLPDAAMRPHVSLADIIDHCYAAGGFAGFTRDDYLKSCTAIARTGQPHQAILTMQDGRTIAIQQQPMPDGGWVATHEDITERRRAEEQIAFFARHDVLTGLPNRSLLMERIGQARSNAGRGASFAVLFLDLDRFKAVNDTLGHAAGDALLRAVAERLLATVREGDTVARLGGDEFVVLLSRLLTPKDAAVLAGRIIAEVGAPYTIGGNDVVIGVSIGIDIATDDSVAAEDLLKNADLALYLSKSEGRGTFRFFAPEMDATVQNRNALERDLRCALDRSEFELYYQPIVDTSSGLAYGCEALLRWNHPSCGVLGPEDFIGVAEECGLILPIGEWVMRQACREAAGWPDNIQIAVNLSAVQFRAANLVDMVVEALADAGLPAGRLELQINEAVLLQSRERNLSVMNRLHERGVGFVLDDFGGGFSALSHLQRFPFRRIEIERSIVNDLATRAETAHVIRAIVGLCRDLGIRTTAEGVETPGQLTRLRAEGCTEMQGDLFSRPRSASRLAGLIGGVRLIAAEPAAGGPFAAADDLNRVA